VRSHYIVTYDVCDPTRLRKVHRIMRDFGDAIQLSVFACVLSRKDLATLESRLLDVLDQARDQVLFADLGRAAAGEDLDEDGPPRCHVLGRKVTPNLVRVWVL
jgi:CRISPR-associated protein Cas2